MDFAQQVQDKGKKFSLERCSPPVVAQLNMVLAFSCGAQVTSVMAPYFCGGCNEQSSRQIDLSGDATAQIAQPLPCPRCKKDMEFDEIIEQFLSFQQRPT